MRATQWLRGLLPVGVLWALLVPAGALGFLDVHPNSWYYEAVTYAEQRNMVSGTSKTEFSPQQTMTRGQFITILGRMAGAPSQVSGQSSFSDVEPGKYYSPYVVWATEKGFILADAGTFRPNEGILREEMAVILNAFLADRDLDLPQEGRDSFADEGSIWGEQPNCVSRCGAKIHANGRVRPCQVAA